MPPAKESTEHHALLAAISTDANSDDPFRLADAGVTGEWGKREEVIHGFISGAL